MTTFVIARNTLGEALRKKILWIFVIVALALIVLPASLVDFSFREQDTIIRSLGLGLLAIVGLLIVLMLGINLISVEIERRTIYTILSKPVKRHEFLLGKYLGAMATLFINLLLISVVFVGMITVKNHGQFQWELFKGTLMIFFQLMMVGAVAMLFSVFTTPVVNFFMTSAVYIVGNMSDYTESMMKADGQNAIMKAFYGAIHWAIPNFSNFNVQNPLIHPEVVIKSELRYYGENILLAVAWISVLLLVSVLIFEKRDM
jgi:ABC-type transport system involved in multi-copper enzyme maturation permease subunit